MINLNDNEIDMLFRKACGSDWKKAAKANKYNFESFDSIFGAYDITDILIADTGRFCERFLSDLLVTLKQMDRTIENAIKNKEETDNIFVFGIREDGVDSNGYVYTRIAETNIPVSTFIDLYYKRLYAVIVHVDPVDRTTTVRLYNIKQSLGTTWNNLVNYGKQVLTC